MYKRMVPLPNWKKETDIPPLPTNFDRFEKIMKKGIFKVDTSMKSLVGSKKIYNISLTYDKIDEFMELFSKVDYSCDSDVIINVNFYDERERLENDEREKIKELMCFFKNKLINVVDVVNLNLSNSTMGNYNRVINKIFLTEEKIPSFRYRLSIDRHPVNYWDRFELCMSKCLGKVEFSISQLMMLSNDDLEYLYRNNYISSRYYRDATELKETIYRFDRYLINNYDVDNMGDFHKFMVVYNYMKENIKYASEATMMVDGIQTINPDSDAANWAFDPYDTYVNSKGICSGQSRLMSILLNHSVLKMDSYVLSGEHKGTLHAWVGVVIDKKLYQCCITMRKPLLSLDMLGYKLDSSNKVNKVYPSGYLTMSQVDMINRDLEVGGKYRKSSSLVKTLEKDKI